MKFVIALILGLFAMPLVAMADTYCGSVSNNVSVLQPTITGSPKPISLATYDLNTHGLSVQYAGNRADYFVGVPVQLIVGRFYVPWAAVSRYPTALVQDGSTCPVLASTGSPILTTNLAFPTVSPFVTSLCPALTGQDKMLLVSVLQSPMSVYQAVYDTVQRWLFVAFADGTAVMFTKVPPAAVNGSVIWNDLSTYPEAIMAEPKTCPLLAQ